MAHKETRGRKKIDNAAAVEEAISTPEKRQVFFDQLHKLAREKESVASKAKFLAEDVKGVAEAYSMSKGFVGGLVTKIVKQSLEEDIAMLTNTVDILTLLNEE
jgi:hypothetical protein